MRPSESLKFKRPLRDHQKIALDRFADESEVGLFWEMGTGKTTEAIAWLRHKYSVAKAVTPTLIVSPVATLYNWLEEFKINAPITTSEQVLVPYMKSRRTKYTGLEKAGVIASSDKKIIVVNGEAFDDEAVVAVLRKFRPVNFVLDEAHKFKSPNLFSGNGKQKKPSRPEQLRSVSELADNRMILTGTPILNGYLDLWSQFYILDKGATFGTNFYTYRETYFEDKNAGWGKSGDKRYYPNWLPKSHVEEQVAAKIAAKTARLRKEDCLTLPPLVQMNHYVELSPEQAKAYDSMEKELVAEVEAGTCAAFNALSAVSRLLHILSGYLPVREDASGDQIQYYFKSNPRLDACAELLAELTPAHKVIVWVSFQANYQRVRDVMHALGLEWSELTGQTKNRQEEIDRFQNDPKCRVMMANAQAGGVGVNLTAASYSIYYSRSYSLGDRLQSEARNHRGGSEIHSKITQIDLVAKDTLDEDVLAALIRKEDFADKVLDKIRLRKHDASDS